MHEAIKEQLRKPPTPEQIARFKERWEGLQAYLEKPDHDGNCHCVRCMNEFSEHMRKKQCLTA